MVSKTLTTGDLSLQIQRNKMEKLKAKPEFLENYDQDKWHKFEYHTKKIQTTIFEDSRYSHV